MTAFFVPLNSSEPDTLTAKEQALVNKGAVMEMYKPDEHSRHFIAHIDSVTDPKTGKARNVPDKSQSVVCFVFGIEDAEPAREQGRSMQNFTIVLHRLTNFFLHKAGTSTTTDFSPDVMFRKVKTLTIRR